MGGKSGKVGKAMNGGGVNVTSGDNVSVAGICATVACGVKVTLGAQLTSTQVNNAANSVFFMKSPFLFVRGGALFQLPPQEFQLKL